MSNIKSVADCIYEAFLDTIQEAEELGGPELPQYIALMDKISAEAIKRGNEARFALANQARERIAGFNNSNPLTKRDDPA